MMTAHMPQAHADEIQGTPKATIGGAFLGAEVVAIPMGIAGVKAGWAYAVFPPLGAVGGAIGGYFMDKAYDDSKTAAYGSAFMLAGGMALIIPAIVLMLNATRYHPSADATEDRAPKNVGPEANPGSSGGGAVVPTSGGGTSAPPPSSGTSGTPSTGGGGNQPPYVPLSLVDMHQGTLRMGIPVPEVHNAYSMQQLKELGVRQATELRVPVFKLAF
ncbi:MAG TPA: hypothetical protein VH054_03980 [Polyangiaceae bacterium]|nr:hypothetical protein [Polyangiaceae bacterium]